MSTDRDLTCQEAQELLPLVAAAGFEAPGLEPGMADRLRDHLDRCADCRRILGECVELVLAAGQDLPSEWIVDLADGVPLDPRHEEIARKHLEQSAHSRELLAMARNEQGRSDQARNDQARSNQALEKWARRDRAVDREGRRRRRVSVRRGWLAAAAMIVLSLGWFGTWRQLQDTRNPIERPDAPMMGALVEVPPLTAERGDGERTEIRLEGSPFLVLVLISEVTGSPGSATTLEIRGPGGERLASIEEPRRSEAGLYSLVLPAGGLEPGVYRAEILDRESVLERFEFRVVAD